MADFKDVIIRLQENKNDNREVIQEQTTVLSNAFKETIKSQNRSFGQSLSRQQQKSSDALSGIASMLGQQTQITKDVTKDDDVVEKQSVGGLEAIAIILTDILGVLNTSLAINQQMADEQERLKLLDLISEIQMKEIEKITRSVNKILKEYFDSLDLLLVDFKLEFGLNPLGKLVIADEISPDNCRFWDKKNSDPKERILDKDRFRQDLGGVIDAYEEILKRIEKDSSKAT